MKAFKFVTIAVLLFLVAMAGGQETVQSAAPAGLSGAPGCPVTQFLPIVMQPGQSGTTSAGIPVVTASNGIDGLYHSSQPDFNGDGCADVAVGVPGKDLTTGSGSRHGQVNIIYGGWNGLTAIGNQSWHRGGGFDQDGNSLGDIQLGLQGNDMFGSAQATGDFNRDGYSDLAIGVSESIASASTNAGVVQVLYGSEDGLTAAGNQAWSQSGGWVDPEGDGSGLYMGDLYGGTEDNDRFGKSVAAGDFNHDGYTDLAIGVPQEAIGSTANAGAVNIIFGSPDGLTWIGNEFWHQNGGVREQNGTGNYVGIGDILGFVEAGDYFGDAVTVGDFDGDSYADLAVGAYGEAIGSTSDAGAVNIIRGSAAGLTALGNQSWHQDGAFEDTDGDGVSDIDVGNPSGAADEADWLGLAIAAADFNGDGYSDLAASAPREDLFEMENGVVIEEEDTGVIHIWYGSAFGLAVQGQRFWAQDIIEGVGDLQGSDREPFDRFGEQLAVGDLNGDGYADIAAGAPAEALAGDTEVGAVSILYGVSSGLGVPGHQWLSQDNSVGDDGQSIGDFVGEAGSGHRFGDALFIADLNNDGQDELVIGTPRYELSGSSDPAGALNVLLGSSAGAQFMGNQQWTLAGGLNDASEFLGDLWGEPGDDWFAQAFP